MWSVSYDPYRQNPSKDGRLIPKTVKSYLEKNCWLKRLVNVNYKSLSLDTSLLLRTAAPTFFFAPNSPIVIPFITYFVVAVYVVTVITLVPMICAY